VPQAQKSAFLSAPEGNAAKQSPEKRSGALPRRTAIAQSAVANPIARKRKAQALSARKLPPGEGTRSAFLWDSVPATGDRIASNC
jgi:hypothetical protein